MYIEMIYIHILSALAISVLFFLYNYIFYISTIQEKNREHHLKSCIKDTFVLFVISGGVNYILQEYFHNDFVSKIFQPQTVKKTAEIFTDQPGF